jgi:membrane protein DedA with SNARE-associated domain
MSWAIASLLHSSGYPLIAIICALIVLEELGIPMPFLPGDFLLVLAGVAVATSHLNPAVVATAAYLSAILGAVVGREIFERLGATALPKLARFPHASDRVRSLSAKLRKSGSTAVFSGRITPGLRVVTTQVSGLVALPRRTFVAGLLPAVAVYEGVFLGLGAWLGPAARSTIEHHAVQLIVLFVLIAVSVLAAHVLVSLARRGAPARPRWVARLWPE